LHDSRAEICEGEYSQASRATDHHVTVSDGGTRTQAAPLSPESTADATTRDQIGAPTGWFSVDAAPSAHPPLSERHNSAIGRAILPVPLPASEAPMSRAAASANPTSSRAASRSMVGWPLGLFGVACGLGLAMTGIGPDRIVAAAFDRSVDTRALGTGVRSPVGDESYWLSRAASREPTIVLSPVALQSSASPMLDVKAPVRGDRLTLAVGTGGRSRALEVVDVKKLTGAALEALGEAPPIAKGGSAPVEHWLVVARVVGASGTADHGRTVRLILDTVAVVGAKAL
jgi:hypothetical protein